MKSGNVKIEIVGTQVMGTEQDETFVTAEGIYEREQDVVTVRYIEKIEESLEIQNRIRLQGNGVTISKRGAIVSDMHFVAGEQSEVAYQTPYGTISMEIRCRNVSIKEEEQSCNIEVEYALYSGGELVSECHTKIGIISI